MGSYKLAYSNDGEHWKIYQDEKQKKDKVKQREKSVFWLWQYHWWKSADYSVGFHMHGILQIGVKVNKRVR